MNLSEVVKNWNGADEFLSQKIDDIKSVATPSSDGLMSSSDKSELDSLSNLFTIIEE